MVAQFKALRGYHPVHDITKDNVDRYLRRRPPWYFADQHRGEGSFYAVCPHCDNPIQLKALYARSENSPRSYGSHLGKAIVPGMPFNEEAQQSCPYITDSLYGSKTKKRSFSQLSKDIIRLICTNYDVVSDELRTLTGVNFSNAFAQRLLSDFLAVGGYDYYRASLINAPYMVLYFASAQNLYAQTIDKSSHLASILERKVTNLELSNSGQIRQTHGFVKITVEFTLHKRRTNEDGVEESLVMRVFDERARPLSQEPSPIYEQELSFEPKRFQEAVLSANKERKTALRDFGLAKLNALNIGATHD